MKRFLSLLLSIVLVLSVSVNTAFANTDGITMIEKTKIVTDTTNVQNYTAGTGDYTGTQALYQDGTRQNWIYIPHNGNKVKTYTVSTNTEDFGNPVLQLDCDTGSYFQIMHDATIKSSSGITVRGVTGKRAVVEGKVLTTAANNTSTYWTVNSTTYKLTIPEALKANVWYNFKWEVELGSTFTIEYTEILPESSEDEPHSFTKSISFPVELKYIRVWSPCTGGNTLYLDDVKLFVEDTPYEKAQIVSVGTDGEVDDGQNIIPVELTEGIPNIKKEHVIVNENGKDENIVSDIEVVDEGDSHILNIICKQNLPNWSDYTLTIDPLAFGEGAVQVTDGVAEDVTAISADFKTKKPAFGMKEPEFTVADGTLNAKALVVNTSGTPEDTSFVFSAFSSDGAPLGVSSKTFEDFSNAEGEYLESSISTDKGNIFNFFVINGWDLKTPLFGKAYRLNAQGEFIEAVPGQSCDSLEGTVPEIALGEFDYDNKKITFMADIKEEKIADGILYVYKADDILSDTNLPLYAEYISTATDGTLSKDIVFDESFTYGEYTVEFFPSGADSSLAENFNYYTPDELIELRKAELVAAAKACATDAELKELILGVTSDGTLINDNFDFICESADKENYEKTEDKDKVFEIMFASVSSLTDYTSFITLFDNSVKQRRADEIAAQKLVICSEAKSSQTHGALRMVILGVNEKDEVVNTNFEVVSTDANMTNYNKLKSKDKVFTKMHSKLSQVSDYDSLIELFEKCAKEQYNDENESKQSPSSNNKGYGGSSVAVKETVNNPVVTAPESGNAAVSAGKFADMKSHWAESYVNELSERGIMNGYNDGSFRGENGITRAELAKTLVEALGVTGSGDASYTDVAYDSWYAPYVARAALAGIVKGYEDGSFAPDMQVTRQDAVLMLYRAMSIGRTLPLGYTFFNDDLDIDDYASGAIRTLGDLGIVNGDANKEFNPKNTITRAEVATIICRALDYIESH